MQRIVVFLLLVAFAFVAWKMWSGQNLQQEVVQKAVQIASENKSFDGSNIGEGNPLENAVGLALQGIHLFQGNKGLELWRLKANWALISQDGDVINVEKPHILYALGETGLPTEENDPDQKNPNLTANNDQEKTEKPQQKAQKSEQESEPDILDVTAQKGKISEHQRFISLWGDVVVLRLGDTVKAPRMEYDSTTRIMTFPEGAYVENDRGNGTAKLLQWDLVKDEIIGQNGIEVIISPQTDPQTDQNDPNDLETDNTQEPSA